MRTVLGNGIEPLESVLLVELYRQFWKPDKVKVILLAESHVFTSNQDRKIAIPPISGLTGYPREYAKFVYCLGYGESGLTNDPGHSALDGTPQFWKIFLSCVKLVNSNKDFAPVLKSGTRLKERILNKINLLMALKNKGVWLVDASICALYANGKKPDSNRMLKAIKTSWDGYTKNVIAAANPEHVIIVGKGVALTVATDVNNITRGKYFVVDQPNARLSTNLHLNNYRTYYHVCN